MVKVAFIVIVILWIHYPKLAMYSMANVNVKMGLEAEGAINVKKISLEILKLNVSRVIVILWDHNPSNAIIKQETVSVLKVIITF